ncbi:MAG: homocysteine S-methyltransferase family protein [Tissierellia bacterium]|nr:homocysteine S-methyltransferase family protein [Tissierellia bacterium]
MDKSLIFLDGAMGTQIQRLGLAPGPQPEKLNISHGKEIEAIHRSYIQAGADMVYAYTFGANPYKYPEGGFREVIWAALKNARKAAQGTRTQVALDIGPLGGLLEPLGEISFERAYDYFAQVIEAGRGADLIVFETMSDLYELKAGILAARDLTDLPIFATMTFQEDGRTFSGVDIDSFVNALDGMGLAGLGINCSLGPEKLYPLVQRMGEICQTDLVVKPNAGMPNMQGGYDLGPEAFVREMKGLHQLGVRYLGGCCGTDPSYIRGLTQALGGKKVIKRTPKPLEGPSSGTRFVPVKGLVVVGESLNPSGREDLQKALLEGDMEVLLREGLGQVQAGAQILDVNVACPGLDEAQAQAKLVKALQAVLDVPLQIDSSQPHALEAGLRVYNGRAIINSLSGERDKLETLLPLAKKYNAQLVALTLDERGLPKTAQDRFEIAKKIVQAAGDHGIPPSDIYMDCLALTLSSNQAQAQETLGALERVKKDLGVKTILGISNISYGLPQRHLLNQSFLTLAMDRGLDLAIVNPRERGIMEAIRSYQVLKGGREDLVTYMKAFGQEVQKEEADKKIDSLREAVLKGLEEEVVQGVKRALEEKSMEAIIEEDLIPALDQVGRDYEVGKTFLPQLIQSAKAAQGGFALLKEVLKSQGRPDLSRGKILVATVKGDVHDIGKNIAKVLMENYGYDLVDLGKDVAPDQILERVQKEDIRLVGLSALMTTSLASMEETIKILKKAQPDLAIMVGGAVLTEAYSKKMGADYYLPDAKANIGVAEAVFGHKKGDPAS